MAQLAVVSTVLASYSELTYGMKVPQLLIQTASELHKAFEDGSLGNPITVDEKIFYNKELSDNDSDEYDDEVWPDVFGTQGTQSSQVAPKRFDLNQEEAAKLNRRIRHDMRLVHYAGFYGEYLCINEFLRPADS